jgi:lipopolysaccharide/colanic/teichoic acid biosynthesis glycosyltransferase
MTTISTMISRDAFPAIPSAVRPPRAKRLRPYRKPVTAHPIHETLFRAAIVREKKRADRFEEPFVLVLVSVNGTADSRARWAGVFEGLSQALGDADVVGWFEQDATLGLIRSIGSHEHRDLAITLASDVQREMMQNVTTGTLDSCGVQIEVYSPQRQLRPAPLVAKVCSPQRGMSKHLAKRVLDIIGSAAFLVASSPLLLFVSALVKLTSNGPVLFPQQRVGADGRPFQMFKFRTMHINNDDRIHKEYMEKFIRSSRPSVVGSNVPFKIVDDPRVTKIGHFLRRSSLDELPQLWNVLKGDMSLVGPRPPIPYEVVRYKRWHQRRILEAKPGITGLWQVKGRSRTTFDEQVRMDLRYAKDPSVWADLKILLATPRAVISGKGAH